MAFSMELLTTQLKVVSRHESYTPMYTNLYLKNHQIIRYVHNENKSIIFICGGDKYTHEFKQI